MGAQKQKLEQAVDAWRRDAEHWRARYDSLAAPGAFCISGGFRTRQSRTSSWELWAWAVRERGQPCGKQLLRTMSTACSLNKKMAGDGGSGQGMCAAMITFTHLMSQ